MERTGLHKKTGVEYKNIYVPSHAKNLLDRQTLWNEVEKSELKKMVISTYRKTCQRI
jgi:hypothetical protein